MKQYNYQNIKEDTHVFHMWEPLKFEIKDNYKYIPSNFFFKLISNILALPISILLTIIGKILFGYKIENKEKLLKSGVFISISNHIHPVEGILRINIFFLPKI